MKRSRLRAKILSNRDNANACFKATNLHYLGYVLYKMLWAGFIL